MFNQLQDDEDARESPSETVAQAGAPGKRGRKRFLPRMNNSERARYYRRKDTLKLAEKKDQVRNLCRDIASLRFQVCLHRRLVEHVVAEQARYQIANHVAAFLSSQLEQLAPVLRKCRHEIKSMEIRGEVAALVVRLECVLRGQLLPSVVRRIYPHVLGNSVAMGRMMHSDVEYPCYCEFFFELDGSLAHRIVEVDSACGLANMLGSLRTAGHVLADVNIRDELESSTIYVQTKDETQDEQHPSIVTPE